MMVCDLLAMEQLLTQLLSHIAEIVSQYQVTMAGPSQKSDSRVIQVSIPLRHCLHAARYGCV